MPALTVRRIGGFDVEQPKLDEDRGGGVDKFGRHLKNLSLQEDFIRNVKTVVLVSDNDDQNAFARVRNQITQTGYTLPSAPLELVTTRDKPQLAILLVPEAPPGCLETLCHKAARTKWPELANPLDDYVKASPTNLWIEPKKAKASLACILAATCEEMPKVPFHLLWQKKEIYHIPLDDPIFDGIADFLGSL